MNYKVNKISSIEEFISSYWNYYLTIEKEFLNTEYYLAIDSLNSTAYSVAYMKLLLEIGSEVDVVCKQLCSLLDCKFDANDSNIDDYLRIIDFNLPNFRSEEILIKARRITPWLNMFEKKIDKVKIQSIIWWNVYTGVKHHRSDSVSGGVKNYTLANQENIIHALASLYQVEMYYLREIIKKNELDNQNTQLKPIIGSTLFALKSMTPFFERQLYSEYYFDQIRIRMM